MILPFGVTPAAAYIDSLLPDIIPDKIRKAQDIHGVPCLCEAGCRFLSMIAMTARPERIIDIGCGAGASTSALIKGAPKAHITAIDANKERAELCRSLTDGNVTVLHANALDYLKSCTQSFDMAFVDSIKKEYGSIWHCLRPFMRSGSVVVFDDVLLHGYVADDDAFTPVKYQDGAHELRQFLKEICADESLFCQIMPIGGGMLTVYIPE